MQELRDLVDVIERSCAHVRRQETGIDFYAALFAVLKRFGDEPRIAALIADMRLEVLALQRALQEADAAFIAQASAIRDRVPSAPWDTATEGGMREQHNLRAFDATLANYARTPDDLGVPSYGAVRQSSRARSLITILETRISNIPDEGPHADLKATLKSELRRVAERQRAENNGYLLATTTHAGFAAARLELHMRQLTPRDDSLELLQHVYGDPAVTRELVFTYGVDPRVKSFGAIKAHVVEDLQRVCDELHLRISQHLSRRVLVARFKQRCEWHDNTRVRELLNSAGGRREDALVDELARFLFDQGMNPLTRTVVGRFEPDAFDPWMSRGPFYVEAKQYSDRQGARHAARRGAWQVWDTLQQWRGTRHECREAFLLVFRLGGPHLAMPDEVRSESVKLIPILVDIAPADVSGSRQREVPVEVTSAEMAPGVPADAD